MVVEKIRECLFSDQEARVLSVAIPRGLRKRQADFREPDQPPVLGRWFRHVVRPSQSSTGFITSSNGITIGESGIRSVLSGTCTTPARDLNSLSRVFGLMIQK